MRIFLVLTQPANIMYVSSLVIKEQHVSVSNAAHLMKPASSKAHNPDLVKCSRGYDLLYSFPKYFLLDSNRSKMEQGGAGGMRGMGRGGCKGSLFFPLFDKNICFKLYK